MFGETFETERERERKRVIERLKKLHNEEFHQILNTGQDNELIRHVEHMKRRKMRIKFYSGKIRDATTCIKKK